MHFPHHVWSTFIFEMPEWLKCAQEHETYFMFHQEYLEAQDTETTTLPLLEQMNMLFKAQLGWEEENNNAEAMPTVCRIALTLPWSESRLLMSSFSHFKFLFIYLQKRDNTLKSLGHSIWIN